MFKAENYAKCFLLFIYFAFFALLQVDDDQRNFEQEIHSLFNFLTDK